MTEIKNHKQVYIFWDEGPWYIRLLVLLTAPFYKLMGAQPMISPLVTKPGTKPPAQFLIQFASIFGIEDEASKKSLAIHQRRYLQYFYIILLPALFLALFVLVLFVAIFFPNFPLERWNINVSTALTWILSVAINMIAFLIIFRFEQTIAEKYFADTLALISCLSLLHELSRSDALDVSSHRMNLQMRMNYLSRTLLLLAYRFQSSSPETDQWIYQHFKRMERFVRERERRVVAPTADTLHSLRRDFLGLFSILISGRYGEFESSLTQGEVAETVQPVSQKRRGYGILIGILSIAAPIVILYLIYVNPEKISAVGVNGNTLTLLAVAWLLLSIDAALKLGIVDRISSLARTFRDLQ